MLLENRDIGGFNHIPSGSSNRIENYKHITNAKKLETTRGFLAISLFANFVFILFLVFGFIWG